MTGPATLPAPAPGPAAGAGVTAALPPVGGSWAEYIHGLQDAEHTGHCQHPIRLKGRIAAVDLATGELRSMYDTASDEPSGLLLVPCGNRRESACPPCSTVYKRDARHLVRAGLLGGKGVPETVTTHPCVFATLTAPSFGPVHSRRLRGKTVLPCRPRRDHKVRVCPHGRDLSCPIRHGEHDPRLGRALCPDCYDYTAAVLFNLHARNLWRRFVTYLPRHLARLAGLTQRQLRSMVAIRYVDVAEYQARGVVHFHAVIRLDGRGADYQTPPARFTAAVLAEAIRSAAAAVTWPVVPDDDHPDCPALLLRFGNQTDCRIIRDGQVDGLPGTGERLDVGAVGNYIAKYATKALDAPGVPDSRLRSSTDLANLRCSRHYRRMIETAWELGGGKLTPAGSRLCRWAHMLGYGGHFLTKSRRYSTTFARLRRARAEYRKAQRWPDGERDPWDRPLDESVVLILRTWSFAGTGYTTNAAEELALASAARARERQRELDPQPAQSTGEGIHLASRN